MCDEAVSFMTEHSGSQPSHLLQFSFISTFQESWKLVKSAGFPATTSNKSLLNRKCYAGHMVYGKRNRRDGIAFLHDGTLRYGLAQCVFAPVQSRMSRNARLILILLLDQIDPDQDNSTVVTKFGHSRFQFSRSEAGHINVALIQATNLLSPEMFVLDPYWLKRNHGVHTKFEAILDSNELLPSARFFKFNNFNFKERSQATAQ